MLYSINMPPLWGFKTFVCRACYKHVAPLGLRLPGCRCSINMSPLWGFKTFVARVMRLSCSINMSPLWGFKTFVCRACYKHVAPLGARL